MGKVMIFGIVGLGLVAALYSMNTKQAMFEASSRVADEQYEVLARNAALAGFQIGRQKLSETFAGGRVTGDYAKGTYETDVVVNGKNATIKSIGTTGSARYDNRQYEVRAHFYKVRVLHDHAPVFMEYAILSDADLVLGGNVNAEVVVDGTRSSKLNANVHTNSDLRVIGNSVSVGGFGSWTGGGTSNPPSALEGSFDPGYNPTSEPTAGWAQEVEIPSLDFDAMTATTNVDGSTWVDNLSTGDVSMTGGSYSYGGTRENPYVWHIQGDLSFSGNTSLDGYVVFMVEGNVDIGGGVSMGDTGWTGAEETSIGIYATGNVTLQGNGSLEGAIFAEGDVTLLQGTPEIIGGITTKSQLIIQGDPLIQFRPISTSITQAWQEERYVFEMRGYFEK